MSGLSPAGAATGRARITAILRRAAASRLVRLLATLLALGLLALLIDPQALMDGIRNADPGLFAAATAALLVALVLGGVRWWILLRGAGVTGSTARVARAYAVGTFANSFLPAAFGGDAVRAVMVASRRSEIVPAAASIVIDRLTGVACLFVVAWAGVLVNGGAVPTPLVVTLAWLTVAGVGLTVLAVCATRGAGARLAARLPARVRGIMSSARDAVLATARAGFRPLFLVTLLGIAYQALVVLETWLLARAIGVDVPFVVMGVAVTIVLVVTFIPFSIAGLGIREGGYVAVLAPAGVAATDAVLLSLLTLAAFAIASSPGALAMLVREAEPPSVIEETSPDPVSSS